MKLATATKKLENAGYKIQTNGAHYVASNDNRTISFCANGDQVSSKFTYDSVNACAPTYGLTLKAAMA